MGSQMPSPRAAHHNHAETIMCLGQTNSHDNNNLLTVFYQLRDALVSLKKWFIHCGLHMTLVSAFIWRPLWMHIITQMLQE